MKYLLPFCFAAYLLFLSFGCDPGWSIDYVIDNQTNSELLVEFIRFEGDSSRLAAVSANNNLPFFMNGSIGQTTRQVLEIRSELPFLFLNISIGDTIQFNGDEMDFSRWEKIKPRNGADPGLIVLTVTESDFQ